MIVFGGECERKKGKEVQTQNFVHFANTFTATRNHNAMDSDRGNQRVMLGKRQRTRERERQENKHF